MEIIDKMSYALWVYSNAASTTVGFYKVIGSDLKELLPHIMTFNKKMAGKVEVQDPMPWGDARTHTWRAIVDNGFDKDPDLYAHLAPDGSNVSDDDMFDYWIEGNDNAESNSAKSREDLLAHLAELSATPASKFSDAVFSLAEFVASMHPEKEKEHLWIGLNFIQCANEVVRVLQAIPAVLNQLGPAATVDFPLVNGPTIRGLPVTHFIGRESGSSLVVCPNGEVWDVRVTADGPDDNPTVSEPVGARLNLTVVDPHRAGLEHWGTIDRPDSGRWPSMPTAEAVLLEIARSPLKSTLTAKAQAMVKQAIAACGPAALRYVATTAS